MTARELHLEVNQSLQKVAANTTRKFLNEEIDWVLNKMQNRYIQLCLKPKLNSQGKSVGAYTVDQLRQDALRNLTVTGKNIPTDITNPRKCKAILPPDYMYLLSDRSQISTDCGDWETSDLVKLYLIVPMPIATTGPYFSTFSMVLSGISVILPGDLFYHDYTFFSKKEDISFILPYVLYMMRRKGIPVYWERCGDIYRENCLILPSGSIDSISYNGISQTLDIESVEVNVTVSSSVLEGFYTTNRLEESSHLYDLLQTAFYKPSIQSPISELEGNTLYVHTDKSFIVPKIQISYIRKPRPISIILGSDCELAEEFHQTICDLTVEYLKGRLEHPEGTIITNQDIENRVIL